MSDPSRLSQRYSTMVVAAVSLLALACLAFLAPVPYVTMRPGPVFDTLGEFDGKPLLVFGKDVKTYPTSGTLDFTTVSVSRADSNVPLSDAIRAYFNDDVAVVPRSLIYPDDKTADQSTDESAAQLSGSKDSSQVAALRAAGYTVTGVPTVATVVKDGPSDGKLRVDDVIQAVDGTTVADGEALVRAIGSRTPGETVRVTVRRGGTAKDVAITTRPAPDDPKVPRIGIELGTKYRYPFTVTNNVGDSIGGPSAGTMFALAIYDKLTPGELTGGEKIAGTGEMSPDGTVGPIGGVRQKMAGASRVGADIFLVPAANCTEAGDGDDFGMTLVKVSTLEQAISSLEALAAGDDAKVVSCS